MSTPLIDREFFDEHGYVVVREAVPAAQCEAVVEALWAFLEMDRDDPSDWFREPRRPGSSMVELYHHQALWDNRQHPRLYAAFAELWGREDLWCSLDRVSLNPPAAASPDGWVSRGFVHWDWDSRERPIPFRVQGVLYLTDTDAEMGGFHCVPGFHNRVEEWAKTQPADRNPRQPDMTGLEVVPIPGRPGDLLIWHVALLHGNGLNRGTRPRLAQYLSMYPAQVSDEAIARRRQSWREQIPPLGSAFPGDPRGWEKAHYGPAELTALGRKIAGVERW